MKKHLKKAAAWITPGRLFAASLLWLGYFSNIRIDFHRLW